MEERIAGIAEFAEVGDFFDQPLKMYSSGMAIRLAFSTAISVDPDVLLVDEALAVGDERFIKKCHYKIKELQNAGKTIIFVTHNSRMVEQYCQQAVLLNGGTLFAQGRVSEVLPLYHKIMEEPDLYAPKRIGNETASAQPVV
ncbi:MAG: ABC transporter ATP-binding protein, partial [Terriglobales bacterium]